MIGWQLGPGDAVPFGGTEEQEEDNRKSHIWYEVVDEAIKPEIPITWRDHTGVYTFPETVLRCVLCGYKWYNEEAKYPCGRPEHFGPDVTYKWAKMPYKPACRSWTKDDIS